MSHAKIPTAYKRIAHENVSARFLALRMRCITEIFFISREMKQSKDAANLDFTKISRAEKYKRFITEETIGLL